MKTTTGELSPAKRSLLRLLPLTVAACFYVRRGHCEELDTAADAAEPENFHRMEVDHLWDHFGCDAIFESGPRPVHRPSDWLRMRKAYGTVVGSEKATIPDDSSAENGDEFRDGFHVPVEARQAEEKGRGVFARAPVKEGQKIWSTSYTARFDNGRDYRRFLAAIPADFACDVLQWAYVQSLSDRDEKTEEAFVSVDLDAGSFINSYNLGDGEEIPPNLGCHPEAAKHEPGGCEHNYFALRDIEVDDELLLDYGEFAVSTGWEWFGL